jgi:hypothetical protein
VSRPIAARAAAALVALLAFAAVTGCARKLPPTGGPPDVSAPSLLATEPDSGAASVAAGTEIRLTFSEAMDRASVTSSVTVGPGVRATSARWENGRTLVLRPDRPLDPDRSYTVIVAPGPRDVRGNPLDRPSVVHFATAAAFPPGRIAGRVEGRGVPPAGVYVWAYREDLDHAPDSTAFDMDGLAQARALGVFSMPGLAVPGRYRLWTFVDRNRNRSFEPGTDLLTPADSAIVLSAESPRADSARVFAVDPEALARVEGVVLDSLAPGSGELRVEARAVPVDSAIAADRVPVIPIDVTQGRFAGNLRAGRWRLVAYRDTDGDRVRAPSEARSAPVEVDLVPGGAAPSIVLVLEPISTSP